MAGKCADFKFHFNFGMRTAQSICVCVPFPNIFLSDRKTLPKLHVAGSNDDLDWTGRRCFT